jgi:hypothetical protein
MSSLKRTRNTEDADIESALFPRVEIAETAYLGVQSYNYIMVDFRNKHQYTTGESVDNPGKKNDVYLKKGNFKQQTGTQILYYIPQAHISLLQNDDTKTKCFVLTKLKEDKYKMANDDAYAIIDKAGVTKAADITGATQGNHFYLDGNESTAELVGTGHFYTVMGAEALGEAGKYRLYYTDLLTAQEEDGGLTELKDKNFSVSTDPYVDIGVGLEHAVPDPIILKLTGEKADGLEMENYWAEPIDADIKADVNAANIILGEDHIVVFNTTDTQKKYITDNTKTGHLLVGKKQGVGYVREDIDNEYTDLFYSFFTTEWRTRLNDGGFLWPKDYITKEHFKQYNDMNCKNKLLKDMYRFYYLSRQDLDDGTKIVNFIVNSATKVYGYVPLTLINIEPTAAPAARAPAAPALIEKITTPASRSAKSSIDEKLDALIYINSELISLLKKLL